MNIVLDEEDFAKLVSGDVITVKGISGEHKIALSDIGYDVMFRIVSEKLAEFMDERFNQKA